MTVLIWGLLGYAASVVPTGAGDGALAALLTPRIGPERASRWAPMVLRGLVAGVAVALAARLVGPYEAAACAVGTVAGHCWPLPRSHRPWPGVPAAAGAFAVLFPLETFAAVIILVAARAVRSGRASVTVALVAVPLLAAVRGQPAPFRFAAWAALLLIAVSRLEGIGDEVAEGASPATAAARRVLLGGGPGPHR